MQIGTKISNLMKERKMTQEELALKIGISQAGIHDLISGKTKKIDFLLMHKVCEVFDVGFEYFLENTQNYHVKSNAGIVGNNGTVNMTNEGFLESILKRLDNLEQKMNK